MDEKSAPVLIQLIQSLCKLGVVFIVCLFAYLAVRELAGKETEAVLNATVAYSNGINGWLIALTTLAIFYAVGERKFREFKIRYLTERIKELESGMDPHRSSSGLTSSGNTRPEDR